MIDKSTWEFINTFAPWFAAIGTLAAVIVSLYLARQDRRIKLMVSAGHRKMVTPGKQGKHPDYIVISVTNVGHREAQVTGLGWEVGLIKKEQAYQSIILDGFSSSIPVRLKDGEKLLTPHRRHLYQLLANERGISHWKISATYGALQLAIGLTILLMRNLESLMVVISILTVCFAAFLIFSFSLRKNLATSI